jgi:predicted nucleic acid-binding protein
LTGSSPRSKKPERFCTGSLKARDPDDSHYVNLALAADAKLIVSRDRDLLDLMDNSIPEGLDFQGRFPSLRILDPVAFLREFEEQN